MKELSSILITKSQIEKLFKLKDAIPIVEQAFKLFAENKTQMPAKIYLNFKNGDLRCMPAYIPCLNAAGLKVVNVHPNNKILPTVSALIILVDPGTGFPLVIMDGKYITDLRTGAAGAIAVRHLARQNSKSAGFIGAGRQAETQLEALMIIKPEIKKIFVYDISRKKIQNFCERYSAKYGGLEVIPADSVKTAVQDADIVITTTPSRVPIVKESYIKAGTHINAIGADAAGKQELESQLTKKSKIVIDNWEQASHSGEINVPLTTGVIGKKDIYGELGEIIIGKKRPRDQKDITIFDSTGLAIQDIACAAFIYKKVRFSKKLQKSLKRIKFLDK